MAQWKAISKGDLWNNNTGNYTIYCSDGTVNRDGTPVTDSEDETLYIREGDYIYFGEYPQTIKADNVSITSTTDSRGYFLGSDGHYYAKVTATPRESDYKFSNEATVVNGEVYYFKVEPIKWRILTEESGKAFILCDSVITSMSWDETSNSYPGSDIRAWLNDQFYNTAFTELQQGVINITTVDNSAESTLISSPFDQENTNDKVFLLSLDEATNSEYGLGTDNDMVRQMKPSDYALAVSTSIDQNGYSRWWTRSRYYGDVNNCHELVSTIAPSGNWSYSDFNKYRVYDTYIGIVPAMWITLN